MAGKFSFEWNYSHSVIVKRKGFGRDLNKHFADLVADYSEEYVPYYEGDLSHYVQTRATEDHGTVTYQVPYANAQYTGHWVDANGREHFINEANRCRDFHPLATSYWDKAAWTQYKSVITKELNEYRKAHSV